MPATTAPCSCRAMVYLTIPDLQVSVETTNIHGLHDRHLLEMMVIVGGRGTTDINGRVGHAKGGLGSVNGLSLIKVATLVQVCHVSV